MSPVLLAALSLLSVAAAQFGQTCDGTPTVADVAALQGRYPPQNQVAQIVAGDAAARTLFSSLASQPPALPLADARDCPPARTWGLSIDDGPTCSSPRLHAHLAAHNIKGSLFYIGSNVARYPNEAKAAYTAGHELCVHTWSHQHSVGLTDEQLFAELYYTKQIIKDVTGVTPRCWRPPYGEIDDRVRRFATALELHAFMWTADTADWRSLSPGGDVLTDGFYRDIANGDYSQHGTIVLTHEAHDPAVNAWITHFPSLQRSFSHFVPAVSGCTNMTRPYAENDAPVFPRFASLIAGEVPRGRMTPITPAGSSGAIVMGGQASFRAAVNGELADALRPTASAAPSAPASSNGPASRLVALSSQQQRFVSLEPSRSAAGHLYKTSLLYVGGVALAVALAL